jgi:hypothetical protein
MQNKKAEEARERAAAEAAAASAKGESRAGLHTVTTPAGKPEERPVEPVPAAAKEAEAKAEPVGGQHAPVDRQDSRSKHRPLAKAVSGPGTAPPADKAAGPPKGAAGGPPSPSGPQGKPPGKRTERPKSPAAAGGGPAPK